MSAPWDRARLRTQIGGPGSGDGQFGFPFGVAVDPAGNVYVTDHDGGVPKTDRVQKFKPSLGGYVYDDRWGITGSGPGQFNEPADVATDSSGNVYVSDRNNHRFRSSTQKASSSPPGAAKGRTMANWSSPRA